jgi:hypothetical protein
MPDFLLYLVFEIQSVFEVFRSVLLCGLFFQPSVIVSVGKTTCSVD